MSKIDSLRACLKLFVTAWLICCLTPASLFAKKIPDGKPITGFEQTVSGTVKDASNGIPLSGATIALKGSSKTVTSDADGSFRITVPDSKSVLVVSYVGYATQEIARWNKRQS